MITTKCNEADGTQKKFHLELNTYIKEVAGDRLSSDGHWPNFSHVTDSDFSRLDATLFSWITAFACAVTAQLGSKSLNGYLFGTR